MCPCIPFITKLFKIYETRSKNERFYLKLLFIAHMVAPLSSYYAIIPSC